MNVELITTQVSGEEADPEIPGLKQAKGKHAKLLQRTDFDRFCRAEIPNYCYQAFALRTPPKEKRVGWGTLANNPEVSFATGWHRIE